MTKKSLLTGILLSWLVPGGGHYYFGKKQKALLYFIALTVAYLTGVVLAEFTNVSIERHPIYFFTTYVFLGSYTLVTALATQGVLITHQLKFGDLGCLYTAVACLLNLLLIVDVIALGAGEQKKARA